MVGRKPSPDPSSAMSIYPPRSLRERLIERAQRQDQAPAGLAVELVRKGLDELDAAEKAGAPANV